MKNYIPQKQSNGKVMTGIDAPGNDDFSFLAGLRVGLITKRSGLHIKWMEGKN